MPRWQVDERHTLEVAAAPDKVFSAIRAVRADEILLFRTLIAIRRCGQSGGPESILNAPEEKPLLDVATQTTFLLLEEETPRELVVGTVIAAPRDTRAAGRLTPELFRETLPPGFVLATMNFVVQPNNRGGSLYRLRPASMRTAGLPFASSAFIGDHPPRKRFIRRMWLRAIKQRAEN